MMFVDNKDPSESSFLADRFPGVPKFPEECSASASATRTFSKLRWATLGLQYNWTTRQYMQDASPPIPAMVEQLANKISSLVGVYVKPEAGLINYYRPYDTLCGHVDDAEQALDMPIISASLGCSCIFLIGRETREVAPIPLVLESGDVIVMSGPCRMFYHGVPRIIEDSIPAHLLPNAEDSDGATLDSNHNQQNDSNRIDWPTCARHLLETHNRINVNVRQVFK
eukprot:c11437_g1_i1.p1 GENE.c11437_g1_i1~~c11437_g1_i1.p1  ORF type:complete len:225 (-),score=37.94 c11437_g1_i1:104-778(-)